MNARWPVFLKIEVAGKQLTHPTYLADVDEFIVGADLFKKNGEVVNVSNAELILKLPPKEE